MTCAISVSGVKLVESLGLHGAAGSLKPVTDENQESRVPPLDFFFFCNDYTCEQVQEKQLLILLYISCVTWLWVSLEPSGYFSVTLCKSFDATWVQTLLRFVLHMIVLEMKV